MTAGIPVKVGARAWTGVILLTAIYTCHYIDRAVLTVLIEPIKKEFDLTDSQIGLLTGLGFAAFYAVVSIPVGRLVDRVNRRNLLAGMVFLWSGCTVLCGFATNLWQLTAARLAVGCAEAGAAPTSMSMISDMFPARRRAMAIGIFWSSVSIGSALALGIGGYVGEHLGWRMAFFLAGAPGLLLVVLLLLLVREPVRGANELLASPEAQRPVRVTEVWRRAFADSVFRPAFLAMVANSVVGSGILIWQVTFLVRVHGTSLTQAGLIAAMVALVCGSVSTFLGGLFADRLAARRPDGGALVPALSCLVASVMVAGFAAAPSLPLAILGLLAWDTSFRMFYGGGNALIMSNVEPQMRGVAAATQQFFTNLLGYGLGPLIIGVGADLMRPALGDHTALRWSIAALIPFSLFACAMFALAGRALNRRAASA